MKDLVKSDQNLNSSGFYFGRKLQNSMRKLFSYRIFKKGTYLTSQLRHTNNKSGYTSFN